MRCFSILMCVLLAGAAYSQTIDKRLAGLDTFVNRVLKDWRAAGCAVAVVEKNKIIYAKGFGYKDWEKKIPATENTQFAIGSCSKAFTSALLGMLVKDGKLDLDKPVHNYLPELQFFNEALTNNVTARDMMCHRTGLPRHDLSWYGATTPRDSLVYRIRFLEPSAPLRQIWQYNNFMFLAQGVLAEKLYGKKWETLVREKILEPLGMVRSNFSVNDLQKDIDFTFGYREQKDSVVRAEYINIDPIGPAGSINSTVKDMGNWVITWINGGKFNGKEVLPASYVSQAMSSQMVVGGGLPSKENPDIHFSTYGFGWFLASYRGHFRVDHGGNIAGFSASTCFFPSDSIGIVVLVNQDGSTVPSIVRNTIADKMLGLSYRNWSKLQKDAVARGKAAAAQRVNTDSINRKPNTKPSHALTDYTGVYENPGYGRVNIMLDKDTLWFNYNQFRRKWYFKHYHYDIFNTFDIDNPEPRGDDFSKVRFIIDNKGDISSFETKMEAAVKEIVFTRVPPTIALTKNDLQPYLGEYELEGLVVKVYLKGENTLMVLVPGQPDYEMVPTKKHEFDFKTLKGFSIKFEVNEKNEVTAASFVQPNGTFTAKRKN
ncbi:MAG TPA: serine hydrolase [Chitinophagaceae bacterium]|nr:serine hydrolase [Chitinophagaceae bacterium]